MNRLRNYILMAAGFAVLVMVVGLFSAGPAIAQAVRAALVSNVDDPGRIPYRTRQTFGGDCSDFGCDVTFGIYSVPNGKRLVITNVAGSVRTSVPLGNEMVLSIIDESNETTIPLIFAGSRNGQNSFVFNQQVLLVYDPKGNPIASLATGAAGSNSVRIDMSGYLLDCIAAPCAAIAP